MGITGCSTDQAVRFLTTVAWNADAAIGAFFESGEAPAGAPPKASAPPPGAFDSAKAEALFAKYEHALEGAPQGYIWDGAAENFTAFFRDGLGLDVETCVGRASAPPRPGHAHTLPPLL